MLTSQNILDTLSSAYPDVTLDQIDTALASVDQSALLATETSSLAASLWDRTTSINGVSATDMLAARTDIDPTGVVYLITDSRSGRVVFFQPLVPDVDGLTWMTAGDYTTYSSAHVTTACTNNADQATIQAVKTALSLQ